jgi:hypothetical protein
MATKGPRWAKGEGFGSRHLWGCRDSSVLDRGCIVLPASRSFLSTRVSFGKPTEGICLSERSSDRRWRRHPLPAQCEAQGWKCTFAAWDMARVLSTQHCNHQRPCSFKPTLHQLPTGTELSLNFRDRDHRELSSSQTCAVPLFLPGYVILDSSDQLAVLISAQCPPHHTSRRVQTPHP